MGPDDDALDRDPRMLRAVLDATRLLIFVVDRHGLVDLTNRAVEQVTCLSGDATRRPLWELAAIPAEAALLKAAFEPFNPETLPSGTLLFHLRTAAISPRWPLTARCGSSATPMTCPPSCSRGSTSRSAWPPSSNCARPRPLRARSSNGSPRSSGRLTGI